MFYCNRKTEHFLCLDLGCFEILHFSCFSHFVWTKALCCSYCGGWIFAFSGIELRVLGRKNAWALVRRRQFRLTMGKSHALSNLLSTFFFLPLSLPSKHLSLSYSSPKCSSSCCSASERNVSGRLLPELPGNVHECSPLAFQA